MARGGHHGGGFHGGGHHSGGFHGGGSFGGGGHYSGGHYSGGSGGGGIGSWAAVFARLGFLGIVATIWFLSMVSQGEVPGMNLLNLGIFAVSVVIFIVALRQYSRTEQVREIKGDPRNRYFGRIWKGPNQPLSSKTDKNSWYSTYDNAFCIALHDKDFGEENVAMVYETVNRTPKIIWMNSFIWLAIGVISFFSTFIFYELVIPVFENMYMSDEAFELIDDLVFYLPSLITLLSAVSCLVFVKIKDNLLYKCAQRIVNNNLAAGTRSKTEQKISTILGDKWYYNNCPNCGSGPFMTLTSCSFCGSSLEIMSFDGNGRFPGAVHRVTYAKQNEKADVKEENKEAAKDAK